MIPKYELMVLLTMYIDTSETPDFDLKLSPFGENGPNAFCKIMNTTILVFY